MSDIDVRAIRDDELTDYLRCLGIAFHFGSTVSDERLAFAREYYTDISRRLGAFVAGSLCGTAASFAAQLTVPGERTVPCAAVTQVTVLPTHRRRGLLGAMMKPQLHDAIERGEVAAMLIAAEWPIYGRFGYGMATEAAATIVDAETAEFRDPTLEGSIELVDPAALAELAPEPFDRHRITSPGAIDRKEKLWPLYADVVSREGMEPPKNRARVMHRDPSGVVDGYAVYDPSDKWEHNRPRVTLSVGELIAATPSAWRDLWRYLCAVDWVTEVRANVRAVDEDVRPQLVNGRAARQADRSDHMWVRLLDVPAALDARRYEVPVRIVLDVRDPYLDRGGRFLLDGGPDGATCRPTDKEPDLSVGIDVLGAAYLGGSRLDGYLLAGRVDEHTDGAVAALDRGMRTSSAPWATTGF
ncbi:MAG TPA: GNAT family N-acetyltransferase [Acidimicrobiales bacterium]|jgi:predicted acetyltransferase|nr:GNAT family N-acetyltransferase [Acidimicrobiales bacterium]